MTLRNLHSLPTTVLFFTAMALSLPAQTGWWNPLSPPPEQPRTGQVFKAGDYVDAQFGGNWIPCTLKDPVWYSPTGPCDAKSATCSTVRAYIVTCVANAASGPHEFTVRLEDVRARAATAEDQSVAAETTAALARQTHGNTVGAKYGTREPRPCGARTAPIHGAPSVEQARQYVVCELEQGDGIHPLFLVTGVKVQVASTPHPANMLVKEITASDVDPREPVWDIRGSYTSYECFPLSSLVASNSFARTHNCWKTEQPVAKGYCYKDTFGDWHCGMLGGNTNTQTNQLPPAGY